MADIQDIVPQSFRDLPKPGVSALQNEYFQTGRDEARQLGASQLGTSGTTGSNESSQRLNNVQGQTYQNFIDATFGTLELNGAQPAGIPELNDALRAKGYEPFSKDSVKDRFDIDDGMLVTPDSINGPVEAHPDEAQPTGENTLDSDQTTTPEEATPPSDQPIGPVGTAPLEAAPPSDQPTTPVEAAPLEAPPPSDQPTSPQGATPYLTQPPPETEDAGPFPELPEIQPPNLPDWIDLPSGVRQHSIHDSTDAPRNP